MKQILGDREKSTLGYKPEVAVASDIPTKAPNRAYEKIPTTPIPPPTTPALERMRTPAYFGPLGPDASWMRPAPSEDNVVQTPPSTSGLARPRLYGPPIPEQEPISLDLLGCIRYAVDHSRDYRGQMDSLYLTALDVTLQRHLFSPIPTARTSLFYDGGQRTSDYRSALTATQSVGVSQQLPYGGTIVAEGLVSFVDALNSNVTGGESATVALRGSIPLLKGAGMVNLEPLISSERQVVYQVRNFESYRRQFVVAIASQYFNLLQQQQGVQNRRVSLRNFESLTERARALYDAGRLNFLEVQRSLQSQFSAQTDLLNAEASYQASVDNFKLIIGMPTDQRLEIVPVEMDVNVPHVPVSEALELAYSYRLDLRTTQDQVEDAMRNVENAKNGLLPDLSLSFNANAGNLSGDPAVAINSATGTYSAGATLDWPIDRLRERNVFRASLITLDRTRRTLTAVRDQIASDVRDDLRRIPVAEDQLRIQQRGIELAQRRLEYSNTLLQQGKIATRDVVEAQTSLLDAQDAYESARSQLQIRILEYLRDTGTLRVDPTAGAIGRAMDRSTH